MDPISLAIGAVGLGMQIFGGMGASSTAKQEAQVSQDIAKQEQQINQVKQTQMNMEAQRMQLENIRNGQRARAMGVNAAVNQGAQFGSGLAGGTAQVQDQTYFNMQGVNNAKAYSTQITGYNDLISQDKSQLASLGGTMATDQGIASLGGSVMKSAPMLGQMGQGLSSGISSAFDLFTKGATGFGL